MLTDGARGRALLKFEACELLANGALRLQNLQVLGLEAADAVLHFDVERLRLEVFCLNVLHFDYVVLARLLELGEEAADSVFVVAVVAEKDFLCVQLARDKLTLEQGLALSQRLVLKHHHRHFPFKFKSHALNIGFVRLLRRLEFVFPFLIIFLKAGALRL